MHLQLGVNMLNIELFSGISEENMLSLLRCLDITTKSYKKNAVIIPFQTKITSIGIVLSGNIEVIREDINRDKITLAKLSENGIFAETIVCAGLEKSPVSVVAKTKCEILFIPYEKIISTCSKACSHHKRLVQNILKVIAQKNLLLSSQIDLLGKKTTREKLLTYLRTVKEEKDSKNFVIPFNRNELADFLCVDRSAMSRELCKMRDDGLIKFDKSYFELLVD